MMALLTSHLEQINLSAKSIGELEFLPSRPFTNAVLHNREITALIRDPEIHERSLFSVTTGAEGVRSDVNGSGHASRGSSGRIFLPSERPRQESAVARVLGAEMLSRIQQSNRHGQKGKGVDVDILLQGAEKLCTAFNVPGTMDRIQALRNKHVAVSSSIARLEVKVSKQQQSLNDYNAGQNPEEEQENNRVSGDHQDVPIDTQKPFVEFDAEAEERAIAELELKKKALEARVTAIEKDLGGLLR